MKTVIVIPTYNEKKSISVLIPKLEETIAGIRHNIHILVVDDNSPDKTADVVKKLQKKYKNLHLIQDEKRGLGVAYLRGFDYAIKELDAKVVFEMDADLSHPPELIPKFMKAIDEGYDLVMGSRYIKGGATPDWNFKRKFISRIGNFFARIISGMYSINDCTSGFRAIRTSLYEKINTKHLHTRGYAFQSTLLYEFITAGARVKQIPLVFYDRKYGESKLSSKDLIEFFFNAWRLRFKSTKRMIRFAVVGSSGILINLGFFMIAKGLLVNDYFNPLTTLLVASLIGDEISIIFNFFANQYYTFKGALKRSAARKKLLKFQIVTIPNIIINNVVLVTLYLGFGLNDTLSKFMGILAAFAWNYLFNVRYIMREKIE